MALEDLGGAQAPDDLPEPGRLHVWMVLLHHPRNPIRVSVVRRVEPELCKQGQPPQHGEAVPVLLPAGLLPPGHPPFPHAYVVGGPEHVVGVVGQVPSHYVGRARRGAAVLDPLVDFAGAGVALRVPRYDLGDLLVGHVLDGDLRRVFGLDARLVVYGYEVNARLVAL